MLAARVVHCTIRTVRSSYSQFNQVPKYPFTLTFLQRTRKFASESRFRRTAGQRRSLKEIIMAPAGETAFTLGQRVVAGGAAFGLGALCYYGLGLSKEAGAIEKSLLWPQYVKDRIQDTYLYFGSSVVVTAASAAMVFRTPALLNLVTKNSWLAIGATFAAMIGSGMICQSIPYSSGLGVKQAAWLLHSSIIGAVIAPLAFIGGPLLIRAAWYTAGVVGGLSTVAICAPSEKFLTLGGPLAIGFGVVLAASIGGMFLPPTTALGAGLYSISVYGGLVLFSGFLLYDTQKIIRKAEVYPVYGVQPFDPVNASIGIYLDTINIFVRIATILSGGSRKK